MSVSRRVRLYCGSSKNDGDIIIEVGVTVELGYWVETKEGRICQDALDALGEGLLAICSIWKVTGLQP